VLGAVALLEMTCDGVQAIHDAGFAHCDLKARNVLLDGRGRAAVGDLGLAARAGRHGRLLQTLVGGTADYMAPEVIAGVTRVVAATVDVYALGILAFALVTGRRPFVGRTAADVFSQHVGRTVPVASSIRRGLPPSLDAAIAAAMDKDPQRRTATARAFADALGVAAAPLRRISRRDHRGSCH
jgi:serine/threonine-protein kinase